ncbi:MAG: gamma-glutamyltransferase [Xenococcaceae cyanobacterium MO_188.B32]|nr:gamma-glutamyltransferase [Xenococcaceae cyanobacterium MO_188.B32]
MSKVTIASGSEISARGGATIADCGGNAVDSALAAALVSMCTEPGVIAPGANGFITIWHPDREPIVIDAYGEMPGRGLENNHFGQGMREVFLDYGGGMSTLVGHGSIATPGIFAGLGMASKLYGNLPWAEITVPAQKSVARGFPLSAVAAEYFYYSHRLIFGWHPESYRVLHDDDGNCLQAGDIIRIPGLADSLQLIGEQGVDAFYTGEIGQKIVREIQASEGLLTARDLAEYRAIARSSIRIKFKDWDIVTNPAPAVGGACLAAMLLQMEGQSFSQWNEHTIQTIAEIQRNVFQYRSKYLEGASLDTMNQEAVRLLDLAAGGNLHKSMQSPSTIHVSAVDSDGLACSVSASAGYGSGVMIDGLWLNNSLGEIELHPQGLRGLSPGTRLTSNMAPTIARHKDGTVLAIGSPGASRITSAIAQTMFNFICLNMPLDEAIAHPRLHFEIFEGVPTVAFETGLAIDTLPNFEPRQFKSLSMYFGGVQAALSDPTTGLVAAADPRRAGGVGYGGTQ